jgi:hypothetical protein
LLSTPFVQEVCHEMRAQGAVSLFSMPIGHKYGDVIPDPKAEPDAMHGETEGLTCSIATGGLKE